jgi:hypothetical protein
MSPEQKAKFKKYVEQGVQSMRELEVLNEDLKNLGSIVKEELEYPAAEFKAVVKAKFQQDKVQQQIDKLTQSLETANSL